MRAAWFEHFGPAGEVLKLGQKEKPEPGPGEVLVHLSASGVNPSDVKKRAGSAPALLDAGPVIPHSDGAGVIEAVGEGVPAGRVGERVWVYQAQHGRRFGTAAEYVALDSRRAASLPAGCSFEVGACLGIPVMTAHRCVFADGPVTGQSILVTGGAGRVGHYAVQWASQAGATVLATASNEDDRAACRAAGAAAVVNHRERDWAQRALDATGGRRIDRVIDLEFGQNLGAVLDLLKVSGTLVTYGSAAVPEPVIPFYRMMFMDLLVRMVIVYDMPEDAKDAAIADIGRALENNLLQHRLARVLPLAEIARAHEEVEEGNTRGCVVVDIGGD
jgi:NADPH2:quinone reductase